MCLGGWWFPVLQGPRRSRLNYDGKKISVVLVGGDQAEPLSVLRWREEGHYTQRKRTKYCCDKIARALRGAGSCGLLFSSQRTNAEWVVAHSLASRPMCSITRGLVNHIPIAHY
ncbi:hypothetical protein BHE74_00034733 [Ensete ventricosum]|nr:hypothetical protein BHE74_00034733 [Ensete ventricosum]